jgi:hypothetical protein
MKTSTRSLVTHRTAVSSEEKRTDGGRALLQELFDDIHGDKRVGKLTAQFGVGGCISSLIFEETETLRQSEIEVDPTIE